MSKKKNNFIYKFLILFLALVTAMFADNSFIYNSEANAANKIEAAVKNRKTDAEILSIINKYQAQYFTIVKRNDLFLDNGEFDIKTNDKKELKKLYKTVKKQITDKTYLKKYKSIEKRYANCYAISTVGMNEFAKKNNDEIDALLNEVYKEVKAKISPADFKLLTLSERQWMKEVDDYKKVFDAQGYGSIGTIIYYSYLTDMKSFRTLLLMLYL